MSLFLSILAFIARFLSFFVFALFTCTHFLVLFVYCKITRHQLVYDADARTSLLQFRVRPRESE